VADLAQHLVLHLYEVKRVEEGAVLEPLGPHALGMQIERVVFLQALCLWIAFAFSSRCLASLDRMHLNICRLV